MRKLLFGLLAIPLLAGCGSITPNNVETVTSETVNMAALIDTELENWDNLGLRTIYNKDNEDKVLEGDVEGRYNRAKRLAEVAEKAVKIYFGEENDLEGKNKEVMAQENILDELGEVKLKALKALESFTYDENITGIYVAAMFEKGSDTKEVLFEVAFNGEDIEDFRLRDTNMDGTGRIEMFTPDEGYYSIDQQSGRIRKIAR